MTWKSIKRWYQGELRPIDPTSPIVVIGGFKRHWTAKLARRCVRFWYDNWKWVIAAVIVPIAIAIIAS
jgi:hypothetical protein